MRYIISPPTRSRRTRGAVALLAALSLLLLGLAPVTLGAESHLPTTPIVEGLSSLSPDSGPIVRCEPILAGPGIIGGDDLIVDMYIENVVDLYGVDLRISFFDTTIAQVVDQSTATGVQIAPLDTFLQPDYVARKIADNTLGTIRYAATQVAPTTPVSGSGPVARITFHGLQVGTFTMTWGTIQLSDINGRLIPATSQPCVVSFQDPNPPDTAIVRCEPEAPAPGVAGVSDVVVDMYVENVVDLYGVDLSMSFFDTTIAQVVDQDSGAGGVQIEPLSTFLQPDFTAVNTADNTAGTIQYATSQVAQPPVSGSGPVARMTFRGLAAGTTPLIWGAVELTTLDGQLIPAITESCLISFRAPAVVRCDPPAVIGALGGDDVTVDMYIENVENLYGVDLGISFFDTTIAQVVDQDSGAGGVQIEPLSTFLQPDFTVVNTADNTAGTIQYATSQVAQPPVSGSGPVARMTFHGLAAEMTPLTWGAVELTTLDGQLIPAITESCIVGFQLPTNVFLRRFEAHREGWSIRVQWETTQESNNLGFNLYRSDSLEGRKIQLNRGLIPASVPGSPLGAVYDFVDKKALYQTRTYYYWLEDLDTHGRTTLHGPVWDGMP